MQAVVKWFSKVKGYGFAVSEEVEGDILVHQSVIEMDGFRYLEPEQEITIDGVESTDNGTRALKINVS